MFMIVSQKGRNLIAIGDRLLRVWGMVDVYDAAQAYGSGRIKFNRKNRVVQLGEGRRLKCQVSEIQSVLGDLSLCIVKLPSSCKDNDEDFDNVGIEDDEFDDKDYNIESIFSQEPQEKYRNRKEFPRREKEKEAEKVKIEKVKTKREEIKKEDNTGRVEAKKAEIKRVKVEDSKTKKAEVKKVDTEKSDVNKSRLKKDETKGSSPRKSELKKSDLKRDKTQKVEKKTPKSSDDLDLSALMSEPSDDLDMDIDKSKSLKSEKTSKNKKGSSKTSKDKPKEILKDNSEAIDIDALFMDNDTDDGIIFNEKNTIIKEAHPKPKAQEDESGFELDDILKDITSEKKRRSDKKETSKNDFNLDSMLKDEKKDSSDDDFDFDDFLSDNSSKKESVDDDFDLNVSEDKSKDDKDKDDFSDDDFDLDFIFNMEEEDEKEPIPTPKESDIKKKETKTVSDDDFDLDLDSLFDDIPSDEKPKPQKNKSSDEVEDDVVIDDIDFDSLFGDEEETPKKDTKKSQKPTSSKKESSNNKVTDKKVKKTTVSKESVKHSKNLDWIKKIVDEFDIDLSKNAQRIEFSKSEYEDLIESFIKDSKDMEDVLRFGSTEDKVSIVSTLSDAITLLHLNPLDKLLQEIAKGEGDEFNEVVDAFYKILDNIAEKIKQSRDKEEFEIDQPTEIEEIEIELEPQKEPEPKKQSENSTSSQAVSVDEFLKDVKMIPIEFSIKIAADELNLPEDLVLEFVNDFSNQGHEYIPELISAYQTGNLDKLQKTAHMLKGAASNLRIEPMVQNLYDLQFDNDITRAPEKIRLFAGQLISLDKYLQQISNS